MTKIIKADKAEKLIKEYHRKKNIIEKKKEDLEEIIEELIEN